MSARVDPPLVPDRRERFCSGIVLCCDHGQPTTRAESGHSCRSRSAADKHGGLKLVDAGFPERFDLI
jgi:hypothetical protein